MHRSILAVLLGMLGAANLAAVEPPARVLQVATGAAPISMAVNPATGQLFALGPEGHLSIIDEVTRHASVVALPSDSFALTADSSANRVYASSLTYPFGGRMTVVDPTTGQTDFVLASPLGVPVANSSTHRVYVTMPQYVYHSGFGYHSIAVFDGETLAEHEIQTTGSRSVALAVDELHDRIYVATMGDLNEFSDTLTIVDGPTEHTTDVTLGCLRGFPAASGPANVAVDPEANRVWVTCYGDPRMLSVDADSPAVSTYPLESTPTLFAVNSATHRLYVALDGRSSLIEIDPEFRTVQEIPMIWTLTGLAVNAQTNTIYAAHSQGMVTLIDGQSHEAIETEVGLGASWIIVDATRDIAWVATTEGVAGLYGPDSPCSRCTRVVRRASN